LTRDGPPHLLLLARRERVRLIGAIMALCIALVRLRLGRNRNQLEVKVEVQASAESLDVVDRRGPASGDSCGALVLERDGLNENPPERSRDAGRALLNSARLTELSTKMCSGASNQPLAAMYLRA
jgi:hypothetical protein